MFDIVLRLGVVKFKVNIDVTCVIIHISVCISNFYQNMSFKSFWYLELTKAMRLFANYSKTVPWLSPIHKEGNKLCFNYLLIYDCTTFTSRENVLNENTVRTEGTQISVYFIMSPVSIVRHCCFMKGWFA